MTVQVNTGENVVYNGETLKVSSESAAYITAVDDNGARISIPRRSPLLSFAKEDLDKVLEENKQEIKGYKQAWSQARDQKWGFIHQIASFWRDLGLASGSTDELNEEQMAQLNAMQGSKSDAVAAMHRASAGVHRTVHESLSAISSFRSMG